MPRSIRRPRFAVALALGALLALQAVSPALAASLYGTTSCTGGKTVNISSRASTYISHSWSGGNSDSWINPTSDYKVSWTNYSSTWRVLEYSATWTSFAGACVQ